MDNAPNRKNWLERNPKKVIGALVLLAIGGLAVVTDTNYMSNIEY